MMKKTTLCYIEYQKNYLMLYRNKKPDDPNEGKWIGIGGKVENNETPEQCMLREVYEETGITLRNWEYRGIVDFVSDVWENERMFLYTAKVEKDTTGICNEGELKWIPIDRITNLNLWEGDRVFLDLLAGGEPYFELTLEYRGEKLVKSIVEKRRNSDF